MLKKMKEKASASAFSLGLNPSYLLAVAAKPYTTRYVVPQFQKFDGKDMTILEHVLWFLKSV